MKDYRYLKDRLTNWIRNHWFCVLLNEIRSARFVVVYFLLQQWNAQIYSWLAAAKKHVYSVNWLISENPSSRMRSLTMTLWVFVVISLLCATSITFTLAQKFYKKLKLKIDRHMTLSISSSKWKSITSVGQG